MAWQRDLRKERSWRKLIREQARSGLSIREFCEARGLREGSFYSWRREVQARDAKRDSVEAGRGPSALNAASPAPSFAAVNVSGWEPPSTVIELVLASGIRVRVPVGFDQRTLYELLSMLEQPAC